jgi:hypothetical protein
LRRAPPRQRPPRQRPPRWPPRHAQQDKQRCHGVTRHVRRTCGKGGFRRPIALTNCCSQGRTISRRLLAGTRADPLLAGLSPAVRSYRLASLHPFPVCSGLCSGRSAAGIHASASSDGR